MKKKISVAECLEHCHLLSGQVSGTGNIGVVVVDKETAENLVHTAHDNGIACEFDVICSCDVGSHYAVYVVVRYIHETVALALCKSSDAVIFEFVRRDRACVID